MKSKKFTFVIPIMVIVLAIAIWMLYKDYTELQLGVRLIIAIGAALLSGVISYFLFPENGEKKRS
ncbi:histidine kinase [Bacillus sp. B15-48]|uniref:histidine kinase n=1 Tax=Bacillus sp. B15-48 TaxID=1548601 RepID=UPI00193FF1F0|nr:histidine kinase [Bacillus sp. B15-48]MBM4763193.1 histidine kinase [Bacillus sp. B15-48]